MIQNVPPNITLYFQGHILMQEGDPSTAVLHNISLQRF